MTSVQWRPIPGRLQSISVASKSKIWGVTLDLQLCKLNPETLQWQLVSVTSEAVNRSRFSSSSTNSAQTTSSTASPIATSATRKFSFILPSLNISLGSGAHHNDHNARALALSQSDQESDSTFQVSAAEDGTVVRLDKTFKTWYLVGSQNRVDFENDVIWIDLGHSWKCVSVASVSQIWGLGDNGNIYYGTSDQFVQLKSPITSGAGYDMPKFTQIAVGQDNIVLATDAHSGTVFRLKTHPASSHPPVWAALEGTGPGTAIHMMCCSLSSVEFIVGLSKEGQVFRRCNGNWIPIGGKIKFSCIDVGIDGYVMGVDRVGDLYACQLQNTMGVPRRVPSRNSQLNRSKDEDLDVPKSPQTPNIPNLPSTPRPQNVSKRPSASSRELFEMESSNRASSPGPSRLSQGDFAREYISNSGRSSPGRYTFGRTESQVSYATELGLDTAQLQRSDSLSKKLANRVTPLRIMASRENSSYRNPDGDSYFTSNPTPGLGPSYDASPSAGSPTSRKRNSTDSRGSSRLACSEALPSEDDRKHPFVKSASSLTSKESEGRWISREDVGNKQELPDPEEPLKLLQLQRPSIADENANATNDTTVAAVSAVVLTPNKESSNSLSIHRSQPQEPDNMGHLKSEWNESVDNMPKPPSQVLNNGYFGPRPGDQLGGSPPFFSTNSDYPLAQPSTPNPGAPYSVNRYPTSMSEPWQGVQRQNQAPGILTAYGSFPRNDRRDDQQPPESMSHDKVPGLASRPSDASDLSLKQQQEFLRLTRLHSNPSAAIDNSGGSPEKAGGAAHVDPDDIENSHSYNDTSISRHSSYKPDNSSGKESYSSSNNGPRGNNSSGPYGNNSNRPQVNHVNNPYDNNANGRRVSYNPYSSNNTLPNGTNNVNSTGKAELSDDMGPMNQQKTGPYGRSSIITTTVTFSGEAAGTNAGLIARRDPYSTSHTEDVHETPGRPSYSSSYLQQYVDTTLLPQPAADVRMSSSFGKQEIDGSAGDSSSLVLRQPRRQSKSQGGIQGEDLQGRWVGGATVSDSPIAQFDPEVHKFKCCLIL
ncbi:hypothetical protein BGZ79_008161 [Entomortierella chlamydospora]|nr:hypothetical protein BGZ79_008161 [Entomortierella chlamydospora]